MPYLPENQLPATKGPVSAAASSGKRRGSLLVSFARATRAAWESIQLVLKGEIMQRCIGPYAELKIHQICVAPVPLVTRFSPVDYNNAS